MQTETTTPPVLNAQANPSLGSRLLRTFPAFRHANYRLYFGGQLISLIGTWLQTVALGWLVWELTHSAFLVGLAATVQTIPVLLFTLFGGVIVDRFSTRRVVFLAEGCAGILAFILGILTLFDVITYTHILILGFIVGIVNAVDMPARQAFVVEMVGKEDMPSAIALNAGVFSAARVVGPTLAGILAYTLGIGWTFILNGVSFAAVLVALFFITVKPFTPNLHSHPLLAIKEGITYTLSQFTILTLLLLAGTVAIFGWSYLTIMPVVAAEVFGQNAAGLGILYAAAGIGSLIGTVVLSVIKKKYIAIKIISFGGILLAISLFLFSYTTNFALALAWMVGVGLGLIMLFATMNATIQNLVDDHFRGRVMSIYTFMFLGMSPFGSFQIGTVAEHFGPQLAIRVCAIAVFICVAIYYWVSLNRGNQSPQETG